MQTTDVYSAMQTGEPLAIYKKTLPCKVQVFLLDPVLKKPVEKILVGKPGEESTLVRLWSQEEMAFFSAMNAYHLSKGNLVLHTVAKAAPEKTIEQSTDEELVHILNGKYMQIMKVANDTTSEAFLNRLLEKAMELEKSEKIIALLRTRLAEVQGEILTDTGE